VTKARQNAEASGNQRIKKKVTIVEDQSQKAKQVDAIETGKSIGNHFWKVSKESYRTQLNSSRRLLT